MFNHRIVKARLLVLLLIAVSCSRVLAQEFKGIVAFKDSISSPVYQAKVTVLNGGNRDVLKTYFDGSFSFPISKNQTYSLFVSFPGYVDTLFTITTDKNNHPNPPTIKVRLKRDGMRLLGIIRSMDDNFPVDSATILQKNILTRKETKQTTGVDGAYNLKLDYETNYSIAIKWRWPGAPDRFRDTMIFISTIGFNQPLDYKLDIYLERLKPGELATGQRMNYDKQPGDDINAVITSNAKSLRPEPPDVLANDFGLMARKLQFESHMRDSIAQANAFRDSVLVAGLKARQKHLVDSLAIANAERERMRSEIIQRKAFGDSVSAALAIARQRNKQDSIALGKIDKGKKPKPSNDEALSDDKAAVKKQVKEDAAKKHTEDSTAKALAASQRQMAKDSIERVKSEREKMVKERAMHKAFEDSLTRAQAAEQKKHTGDSLQQVKVEAEKKAKEQAAKKMVEDSIARVSAAAREKSIVDSIQRAYKEKVKEKEQAARKAAKDSIERSEINAQKKRAEDSLQRVKIETEEKAKEQAAKRAEDSIARALLAAQKKHADDSIMLAKKEAEKKAKEPTTKKLAQDSVAKALAAARQKTMADSVERVKKEKERLEKEQAVRKATQDSIQRALLAAQKKHAEDSLIQVKKEAEKKAKELAVKKAAQDSIARAQALARQKNTADSLQRVKMEKEQAMRKDSIARALLIAQKKHTEDSLQQVKKEAEKKAKEQAAKKAAEDSIARALTAARQKSVTDSIARVKKEKEQAARKASQDSIQRVLLAAQKKRTEDSLQRVKTEAERKEKEQAAKKVMDDSLAKARADKMIELELTAQKKFEDSISRAKARQGASTAAKAKTDGDSTSKIISSLLKREKEDSIKVGMESARRKKLSDSLQIVKSAESKIQMQIGGKKTTLDSIHNTMTTDQARIKSLEAQVSAGNPGSAPLDLQNELAQKKAAQYSLQKMWNQKHKEVADDSLTLKRLEKEKSLMEEATKKAYVDSIVGTLEEKRLKREMDSIKEIREFLTQVAKDKALKQDPLAKTPFSGNSVPGRSPSISVPENINWPGLFSAKISGTPATNMPAIAFGKNSSVAGAGEMERLRSLAKLLAGNPEWQVCIYALSSMDETNPKLLSLKRMDWMKRFLLQEGITVERIRAFYFGSDINLTGCTKVPCPEEALQNNRRAAFQIVKP